MKIKALLLLCIAAAISKPLTGQCMENTTSSRQEILLNISGDWILESPKTIMDMPGGIITVSQKAHLFSTHTFKVLNGRKYSFYAEVRSDDDIKSNVQASLVLCSRLRGIIPVMCYIPAPEETLTQLVQPTAEMQDFIIVKNKPSWLKYYKNGYGVVAFNARQDKSDLPNEKYSTIIQEIEPFGENLKVTFEKKLYEVFPAGTNVRLHKDKGFYLCIDSALPNKEWKQIGGTIEMPANAQYFFPCIIFYGNKEQTVQIRDLRLIVE